MSTALLSVTMYSYSFIVISRTQNDSFLCWLSLSGQPLVYFDRNVQTMHLVEHILHQSSTKVQEWVFSSVKCCRCLHTWDGCIPPANGCCCCCCLFIQGLSSAKGPIFHVMWSKKCCRFLPALGGFLCLLSIAAISGNQNEALRHSPRLIVNSSPCLLR